MFSKALRLLAFAGFLLMATPVGAVLGGPGSTIPHLTQGDFLSKVGNADTPVLIQFDATWCAFCHKMQPFLDDLREKRKGEITVYKVDADDEVELARQYQVVTLPTLLIFYRGNIVSRNEGSLTGEHLDQWVKDAEDRIKAEPRKYGMPKIEEPAPFYTHGL